MDNNLDTESVVLMAMWLLMEILLKDYNELLPPPICEEDDGIDISREILESLAEPSPDPLHDMHNELMAFQLCTPAFVLSEDLGFLVKPRSIKWFSRFLLTEYNDRRWLEVFQMSKKNVFVLADLLAPQILRKDMRYQVAIPVLIRVACSLFKLTQGVSFFICSKMFAIRKSTVCELLREVVHAINATLRYKVSWPIGERLRRSQQKLAILCGLPAVIGVIDGTHVAIAKPQFVPSDYYYFKSGGYTLNCQAVVDSEKRILDTVFGMPGSVNDSCVLRRSVLYKFATYNNLFSNNLGVEGFSPHLLGDQDYPLLPWLMVPHRTNIPLSMADAVFYKRLWKRRCVVENAFGILKQIFGELLTKSELDVVFLPDVIFCCAILHNMLLDQSQEDIDSLFGVLRFEGYRGEVLDNNKAEGDITFGNKGVDAIPDTKFDNAKTKSTLPLQGRY